MLDIQQFSARLSSLSMLLNPQTLTRLHQYYIMLWDASKNFNLTSVKEETEIIDRHMIDSLAPLSFYHLFPDDSTLIDVGSGAGFPGMPISIVRQDLQVVLLEANMKRAAFMDEVVSSLRLRNTRILRMRAEEAGQLAIHRERFDIATARAVAPLPVLMEYLLPFIRIGGYALLWQGPSAQAGITDASNAARLMGGWLQESLRVQIADRDWNHIIIPVTKMTPTPLRYPRRTGIPERRPVSVKLKGSEQ